MGPALREPDRVVRLLPEDDDGEARGRVVAVLQSALARLEAGSGGTNGVVREQIGAASDDEIFAFIDNQF